MENTETPNSSDILTPEQIERCDLDIMTIANLSAFAQSQGLIPVIGGGYATEAHCGGHITRAHGDIDITFYGLVPVDSQHIAQNTASLLSSEKTQWGRHLSEHERTTGEYSTEHIEFREIGKELLPFPERRRVEIEVYEDHHAYKRFVQKTLRNSSGETREVNVKKLSYLLAEKIQRLYEISLLPDEEKGKFGRLTTPTDYKEVYRLLSLPTFTIQEKEECLKIIQRRLERKSGQEIDGNAVFEKVTSLLTPYISTI